MFTTQTFATAILSRLSMAVKASLGPNAETRKKVYLVQLAMVRRLIVLGVVSECFVENPSSSSAITTVGT